MGTTVSVVVTVLNEAKHLADLLDSLTVQENAVEILIVDAGSRDATPQIVREYNARHPQVRLLEKRGPRGASRNLGAQAATGDYLAFIDGDCIANPFWLKHLCQGADARTVLAGRTVTLGYWAFERLQRVELEHKGQDVTHPSCNLLYPRQAFLALGGFDERFITAEDIDLNLRAVEKGMAITRRRDAVVYHRARESASGFLHQAFWNGYGRKQLTLKHGQLWAQYSFQRMIQTNITFWGFFRMISAVLGYLRCTIRESKREWQGPRLAAVQGARA